MYEIGEPEIEAVAAVIRSRQLFRYCGKEEGECDKAERAIRAHLGCEYALLVNSGTSALIGALRACGVGQDDEVIVPAFTFIATAAAAVAVGAKPVLAEVDESLSLDVRDVARKLTSQTRAVIPVHMCGLPCDMDALTGLARERELFIVEDACQAMGGSYKGRFLGTIGDVGAFSFNQFKTITAGEGGAIVTSTRSVYEKALIYHDVGSPVRNYVGLSEPLAPGVNMRVSEITGAILRVQIERLNSIVTRLRANKALMQREFAAARPDGVVLSPVNCVEGDCGQMLMLRAESANLAKSIARELGGAGLAAQPLILTGYHVYTNWKSLLRNGADSPDPCPRTIDLLRRTIAIPVSPLESDADAAARVRKVLQCIAKTHR